MAKKKKKAKKSKSRKMKRKGGGNAVRPTPGVAKAYLARKEKAGIVAAGDIVLENKKEQEIERVRWREANNVWNDYNRRLEAYEAKLDEWKVQNQAFKDAKKKKIEGWKQMSPGARPSKPSMKSKAKDHSRKGNFKRWSKAQAKKYLARVFRHHVADDPTTLLAKQFNVASQYRSKQRIPRLQEAILVAGVDEALKIYNRNRGLATKAAEKKAAAQARAQKAAVTRKINAEAKRVKQAARNAKARATRKTNKLAKLEKELAKINATEQKCKDKAVARRAELAKQRAKIEAVAVASRRRSRKARKARKARKSRKKMMRKKKMMKRRSRKSRKARRRK